LATTTYKEHPAAVSVDSHNCWTIKFERLKMLVALKKCGHVGTPYIAFGLRDQDIEVRETALAVLRALKKNVCMKETLDELQITLRVPPACPQCKPADEARVHDVLRGTRDIIMMCQGQ
jgi:hypothetical protein